VLVSEQPHRPKLSWAKQCVHRAKSMMKDRHDSKVYTYTPLNLDN
jgi:hypothetical protein